MAGPDTRARDSDRDEAVEVIETAYADGQLTREEYDARTGKALTARRLGDLDQLVRDLQEPGRTRVGARLARLAEARGGPAPAGTRVAMADGLAGVARRSAVAVTVIALTVFALLVALPWLLRGSPGVAGDEQAPAPVDVLTPDGFRTFVDAVEDTSGSTVVFRVNVGSHDYGSATVPVDAASDRYVSWTWRDAGFEQGQTSGTDPGSIRFDLARIDADGIPDVVERAAGLVKEPDYLLITVDPADDDLERQCYEVMASNRFSETGRIIATCSGKVLQVDRPETS